MKIDKPRPERSSHTTADTVKIIITAEVGDQKVQLGSTAIRVDEKLDESIYRGMQLTRKVLYEALLHTIDDGIRDSVPETWENKRREKRQTTTCLGTVQYRRRVCTRMKAEDGGSRLMRLLDMINTVDTV